MHSTSLDNHDGHYYFPLSLSLSDILLELLFKHLMLDISLALLTKYIGDISIGDISYNLYFCNIFLFFHFLFIFLSCHVCARTIFGFTFISYYTFYCIAFVQSAQEESSQSTELNKILLSLSLSHFLCTTRLVSQRVFANFKARDQRGTRDVTIFAVALRNAR